MFQCSSASRKFLNLAEAIAGEVGVPRFSALQRAENFSIVLGDDVPVRTEKFQCSSASRKFLNTAAGRAVRLRSAFQCSSASRKFLNLLAANVRAPASAFQCSSASRKFLNGSVGAHAAVDMQFQCSSASRKFLNPDGAYVVERWVRFQCSSASRKFLNRIPVSRNDVSLDVSVLFSEPKISQFGNNSRLSVRRNASFSALQRAENFSITQRSVTAASECGVSVLFSEPKISQFADYAARVPAGLVSVLFSEPKISQLGARGSGRSGGRRFQCSSASRKFLNRRETHCGLCKPHCFSALQRAENFSIFILFDNFA